MATMHTTHHTTPDRRRVRAARRSAGALVTLLAVAGLAACGSDGSDAGDAPPSTAPATAAPTSPAPTPAPSTEHPHDTGSIDHAMVTIGAVDYAFEDVPAEIEAGTQLSLTNTSTEELHELVAMRLPDEERRSAAELLTLPEEQLGAMFGNEPATVLIAPPGAEGMAVVGDGVLTEPGRYILLCGIPIGADPQEYMAAAQSGDGPPQVQGGPPHFATGMFAEIVVR